MDIRNPRALKDAAAQRLSDSREPGKLVLTFAGATCVASLLVTFINFILGLQIDQATGLENLGLNSILSTVQTTLPLLLSFGLLAWEFGYLLTVLRMARGQEVNTGMLKFGFQRFWPLFRMVLLQGLLFGGIAIICFQLSMTIYLLTPLSASFMSLLVPILAETSTLDPNAAAAAAMAALDAEMMASLYSAMTPLFLLFLAGYLALALPMAYSFRMANYCLLDHPQAGALAALRESRKMMRGSRLALAKLDLSFWWYYGLLTLAVLVGYGDVILALAGVTLPISTDAAYFLFYILLLAMELGIYYYARNRLEVTYALFYEALRPKEEPSKGVVLGNIFNM